MTISLQGSFLIAAHHLRDPNFYRSVVLMLEHSPQSAMGLIVNRPTATTIGQALAQHQPINGLDAPVFFGGPVEQNALFVLHNSMTLAQQDQEITPGLYLAGSERSFDQVVCQATPPKINIQFRLLCGYAGWGAGQLESEMERGDWNVLPSAGSMLLEEDPYGFWELCAKRLKRVSALLPQDARNPSWN